MITVESAVVYKVVGGRRYFTKKSAVKSVATRLILARYPTDKYDHETGAGFHWSELKRSDVLLRRVMRIVSKSSPQSPERKQE